ITELFFFSSRRRHTRFSRDWSSDVCSSDLQSGLLFEPEPSRQQALAANFVNLPSSSAFPALRNKITGNPDKAPSRRHFSKSRFRSEERRVGKEGRYRHGWGCVRRKQYKK